MSYKVTTLFRNSIFIFGTNDEATRFNEELFAKTKMNGSISTCDSKPTYRYDNRDKLIKL